MSKTAHPGVGETTPQTNPPAQIHHPRRGSALIRFRWLRAVSFKGGVRKRAGCFWTAAQPAIRVLSKLSNSKLTDTSRAPQAANPLIAAANSFPHGTDTEGEEGIFVSKVCALSLTPVHSTGQQTDVTVSFSLTLWWVVRVRKVCRIGVAVVDSRLPGFRSPENADLRFSVRSTIAGWARGPKSRTPDVSYRAPLGVWGWQARLSRMTRHTFSMRCP
ncbi:hypothetical protein CABS01_08274 [Colletotrichum abscissum]|uniref:uncharacterized protein n=1 Tax=Colletotrichum abscissum TaxID=1671311 RepID=UPI0027D6EAD5|nr:uncharacterized protein CABS01_08274 [Colletotrichum abscissum]KAK1509044.1 hypothetical protein CABS01_08274 [Colletotrichum abscissum]